METPGRPASLALAESQNIQPNEQAGAGVQSVKSTMNTNPNNSSGSASASASAAVAAPTPAATATAKYSYTGAVAGSVEGKSSKTGRQGGGGGMGAAAPPATPAVAPAARVTADTAAAAAAAFATPAAAAAFATPAAPAKAVGAGAAGAAGEGAGGGWAAAAAAAGSAVGGEGGAAEVATDRMILATPTSASAPAAAEPDSASSPTPAAAAAAAATANTADAVDGPVYGEAESLALARQLMEEEAMASYAAAVDIFRTSAAAAAAGGSGIEGVAAEDMAAMQALMEEDENSPDAFAMAEDESLDYDGMLELGSAIGDVRKDRWRMRCKAVIAALPRFSYAAGGSVGVEDTKCLVCQCEYEEGDELRKLPCSHVFHTACVDGWLEQNEECPTCRQSVSPSPQA